MLLSFLQNGFNRFKVKTRQINFSYNVKCRSIIAKSEKKGKGFEDVFRDANRREFFGAPTRLVCTISGVPKLHT